MEELLRTAGAVATPLIAVAALILSIRASKRVKHQREFEIVLEENRREATRREDLFERERAERDKRFEKERAEREQQLQKERAEREAAARAFTERIDREAAKREAETLAEVVAQAVRNDTRVRVMEAARSRKEADPSAPAPGGTEAVAAQAVPSERRPK